MRKYEIVLTDLEFFFDATTNYFRWNRTIKTLMFRAFTEYGNHRWISWIQKLVESYNNSVHSATKFALNAVNPSNEHLVRKNLYPPAKKETQKMKPKFKKGDFVRISRKDNVFRKGYKETFTYEIFQVDKVKPTTPTTYQLKSLNSEPVNGSFYQQEMVKVDRSDNIYPVEKILNKRKRNGVTQYRVRYQGFDNSYNEWVKESDLFPKNVSI